MKKIHLILLFALVSFAALAQKTYVHIHVYDMHRPNPSMVLSGAIPDGMSDYYPENNFNKGKTVGGILNELSENGYTLEHMSVVYQENNAHGYYICSRPTTEQPPTSSSFPTTIEGDSEVYEVARFNLQGFPVNKKDKGFQIIVYSNYTTKALLVE